MFTTRRGSSRQNTHPGPTRALTQSLSSEEHYAMQTRYKEMGIPDARQKFCAGRPIAWAALRLKIDVWERAARATRQSQPEKMKARATG